MARGASLLHHVEELLADDLVILSGEQADLIHRHSLSARLVRDVVQEADCEAIVVRVRTEDLRLVNGVVIHPPLSLGGDRLDAFRSPIHARRCGEDQACCGGPDAGVDGLRRRASSVPPSSAHRTKARIRVSGHGLLGIGTTPTAIPSSSLAAFKRELRSKRVRFAGFDEASWVGGWPMKRALRFIGERVSPHHSKSEV